jgi:hypothetical protein
MSDDADPAPPVSVDVQDKTAFVVSCTDGNGATALDGAVRSTVHDRETTGLSRPLGSRTRIRAVCLPAARPLSDHVGPHVVHVVAASRRH